MTTQLIYNRVTDKIETREKPPTIWDSLVKKLGRTPTNAECREECFRIMAEGRAERASQGKLPHQKKRG